MAEVPYKLYAHDSGFGFKTLQILPGMNTPYGSQEVDLATFKQIAQQSPQAKAQYEAYLADPTYKNVLTQAEAGQTVGSGWSQGVDPLTGKTEWGNQWNQIAADTARNEAAVAAGTMRKVPVGQGYMYIPTSSLIPQIQQVTQPTSTLAEQVANPTSSYQIQSGDTLSKLAQKYGTTVQALMQANPQITDPNKIYAGQSLNIPGSTSQGQTTSQAGLSPDQQAIQQQIQQITGQVQGLQSKYEQAVQAGYGEGGKYAGQQIPDYITDPNAFRQKLQSDFGFSAQQVASIPDSQLGIFSAMGDYLQGQYELGKNVADVNAQTFDQIYQATVNDPEIQQKYGDSLKVGQTDFQRNLQDFQYQYGETGRQLGEQNIAQQKQLSEQEAAAGRAYSGFREQAKQKLTGEQAGIIESTRRQYQKALESAAGAFEQRFGTQALQAQNVPQLSQSTLGTVQYTPYGALTGQEPLQKKQEIASTAEQRYQNIQL